MDFSADASRNETRTVVLRDGGAGCLLWALFPALFFVGVFFDFLWNMVALHISAWLVPSPDEDLNKRRDLYSLLITGLGILIDWPYFNFIRNTVPSNAFGTRFLLLIITAVLLAAANFALGILLLRRSYVRSLGLGVAMGVLTAPWLLLFILR